VSTVAELAIEKAKKAPKSPVLQAQALLSESVKVPSEKKKARKAAKKKKMLQDEPADSSATPAN
jgi:hypothetical protein